MTEIFGLNCSWTTEMEVDLIEEVKKKDYLWNIKSTLYSKKSLKRCGYEEISQILQDRWPLYSSLFEPGLLLSKFSKLRSYYQREVKKCRDLKSRKDFASAYKGFVPRWVHFSRMAFLNDCLESDESKSSISLTQASHEDANSSSGEHNEESLELLPADHNSDQNEIQIAEVETICEQRKRKREDTAEDIIDEDEKFFKKLNISDEDEAYALFVVSRLKKIKDPYMRELTRIEIQQALIKYTYEMLKNRKKSIHQVQAICYQL